MAAAGQYRLVYANHILLSLSLLAATAAPAGLLAAHLAVAAENSSFSPLQEINFWTSSAGNYTFGFQALYGGEESFLLSIWHSKDPNKTPIWWPLGSHDVDYDPAVNKGATFQFTSKGTLQLHNDVGSLLWSTNTTSSSSHAVLLDTGNLLVYHNSMAEVSWQSFDDSWDSLMLAGLDGNRLANKPLLLQSRESQSSYAVGPFYLATDSYINVYLRKKLDLSSNRHFDYLYGKANIDGGFWIGRDYGKNYTNNTSLDLKKLSLDYDGNVRVYKWKSDVSSWVKMWQFVDSKCMLGSPCGPFGICQVDQNGEINCSCPTDFQERVPGVPSQGCESAISFNASCGTLNMPKGKNYSTTMVEMPNVDYNYNDLQQRPLIGVGIDDCKQSCLDSCSDCMAAAYNLDQRQCFLKGNIELGYLMNGVTADASTLLMKVVKELVPVNDGGSAKRGGGWPLIIGVIIAAVLIVVIGLSSAGLLIWRRSLSTLRGNPKSKHSASGAAGAFRFFSYKELVSATDNFSKKLGVGRSGVVYEGWVKVESKEWDIGTKKEKMRVNDAPQQQLCHVAVKTLRSSEHGSCNSISYAQFKSEMITLGRIHHVNLVNLLGYSYSTTANGSKERLLVLEFMENGSLDKYLSTSPHDPSAPKLTWRTCYSIALGTARGIAYLHHECNPPILHCDIKPPNTLLDANFTPKVADFGISERFPPESSHVVVSGYRGTPGYMAPEWFRQNKEITSKVDVYSFGVLLLELVNGCTLRSMDNRMPVQQWAIKCISQLAEMPISVGEDQLQEVCVRDADAMAMDTDSPIKSGAVVNTPPDEVVLLQQQQLELKEKVRLLKVSLWCIQEEPKHRPSMSKVVRLNIEGTTEMDEPPMTCTVQEGN